MRIRSSVLLIFSVLASLPALATRPAISFEQIVDGTPIIFDGQVLEFKEVPAPVKEFYFTDEKQALSARFRVLKQWKGLKQKEVTAFTWPLGKAPCSGVEIKKDAKYLVFAHWDTKKKHILFDFCSGLQTHDGVSSKEVHDKLESILGRRR